MQVTEDGVAVRDGLAVELELEAEHAVGGRVGRAHGDRHFFGLKLSRGGGRNLGGAVGENVFGGHRKRDLGQVGKAGAAGGLFGRGFFAAFGPALVFCARLGVGEVDFTGRGDEGTAHHRGGFGGGSREVADFEVG